MHSEKGLPGLVGGIAKGVDLLDLLIRHRKTSDRNSIPVNHDRAARAPVRAIELVRIADVEREVILAVRLHRRRRHVVETLGHLAITLRKFRPRMTGHTGDFEVRK